MQNLPILHSRIKRPRLYSVTYVSKKLEVSITTLRRWDRNGVLKPLRTTGGQRRYTTAQLKSFNRSRPARTIYSSSEQSESRSNNVILSTAKDLGPRFFTPVQNDKRSDLSGLLGLLQFATHGLLKEISKRTTDTLLNAAVVTIIKPIELTQHMLDMVFLGVEMVFEGSEKGNKKIEDSILSLVDNSLHPAILLSTHLTVHTKNARRTSSHVGRHIQGGFVNFGELLDDIFSLFVHIVITFVDFAVLLVDFLVLTIKTIFMYSKLSFAYT